MRKVHILIAFGKQGVSLFVALAFLAAAAAVPSAPVADPIVANFSDTARSLDQVLSSAGSPELGCADPRLSEALSALDTMTDGLATLQAASVNDNYPDYVRQTSERRFDAAAPIALQAFFSAADHLRSGGCFDLAEQTYRKVVEAFPGPVWSGYRDRAMLGINDVRDRRPAGSAKASEGQKAN